MPGLADEVSAGLQSATQMMLLLPVLCSSSGSYPGAQVFSWSGGATTTPLVLVVDTMSMQVNFESGWPKQPRVGAAGLGLPHAAALSVLRFWVSGSQVGSQKP